MTDITTTTAPVATDARNTVLNLISGQLETVHAIREDRIKWHKEATSLLGQLEVGAVQVLPAGHLEPRDPAASEVK